MSFSTYTALKAEVAEWLNRSDLTARIPEFIRNAESELRDDPRVRKHATTSLTVDAEEESLPSDFKSLESLYLDGPTYFGDIEIVNSGALSDANFDVAGASGVPRKAAVIAGQRLRFAPTPNASYNVRMTYWANVPHLSDTAVTNWLLQERQDIYLYATLMEAAPFLRDDDRIPVWGQNLTSRLEALHRKNQTLQYGGGSLVRRPRRPIGG